MCTPTDQAMYDQYYLWKSIPQIVVAGGTRHEVEEALNILTTWSYKVLITLSVLGGVSRIAIGHEIPFLFIDGYLYNS